MLQRKTECLIYCSIILQGTSQIQEKIDYIEQTLIYLILNKTPCRY
jgi:hypothetical protein